MRDGASGMFDVAWPGASLNVATSAEGSECRHEGVRFWPDPRRPEVFVRGKNLCSVKRNSSACLPAVSLILCVLSSQSAPCHKTTRTLAQPHVNDQFTSGLTWAIGFV